MRSSSYFARVVMGPKFEEHFVAERYLRSKGKRAVLLMLIVVGSRLGSECMRLVEVVEEFARHTTFPSDSIHCSTTLSSNPPPLYTLNVMVKNLSKYTVNKGDNEPALEALSARCSKFSSSSA